MESKSTNHKPLRLLISFLAPRGIGVHKHIDEDVAEISHQPGPVRRDAIFNYWCEHYIQHGFMWGGKFIAPGAILAIEDNSDYPGPMIKEPNKGSMNET